VEREEQSWRGKEEEDPLTVTCDESPKGSSTLDGEIKINLGGSASAIK
jgi:hypothetical protein